MTLHWWMHWFWITCKIFVYISSAHCKPATTATTIAEIETLVIQNRPFRRNIKSVNQNINIRTPIPLLSVTPTKTGISGTAINEIMSQYQTNNITICIYANTTANTMIGKNVTLFCNQTDLTKNDTIKLSVSNVSNTLVVDDKTVTDKNIVDVPNNMTTHLLTKKENSDSSTSISGISISGITFGVLMFVGLIGGTSFMLYRRGFTNKPQTLNDKCSNLDSSGYIDDSSMRENSEEMYSLDNDSFLNSLEAMTIQNYWTDNLKHTKL